MVFKMIKLYVILSYIIIGFGVFLGLRHIDDLQDKMAQHTREIESMKQSQSMVIEAYDQEIKELTETAKERKVVVKEIVKTVKGTKDEECLNRSMPSIVVDKLRQQNSSKK
jgi:hypothetical protein